MASRALPFVLCVDPLFDRFALANRRLGQHWRLGWADGRDSIDRWFRAQQPAAVICFFLEPGPRSLVLVRALRAQTRVPILAHLAREDASFRLSLQLIVDQVLVGPLAFHTLDERLHQLVSPIPS